MMSLSDDKQADIIDAFNTKSGYLNGILNINNNNNNYISLQYAASDYRLHCLLNTEYSIEILVTMKNTTK